MRNEDQGAGQAVHVERPLDQTLYRENRGVLGAVRAGDNREHRTRTSAVDDGDRDVVAGVDAGGHGDDAVSFLSPLRFRGPDCESGMGVLQRGATVSVAAFVVSGFSQTRSNVAAFVVSGFSRTRSSVASVVVSGFSRTGRDQQSKRRGDDQFLHAGNFTTVSTAAYS